MEEILIFGRFKRECAKIQGGMAAPCPQPPCRRPWVLYQTSEMMLVVGNESKVIMNWFRLLNRNPDCLTNIFLSYCPFLLFLRRIEFIIIFHSVLGFFCWKLCGNFVVKVQILGHAWQKITFSVAIAKRSKSTMQSSSHPNRILLRKNL